MQKSDINYKQIYSDILDKKFPEKSLECYSILNKRNLSAIDIIELNKRIFKDNKETEHINQKYRSYNKSDILKILDYQKITQIQQQPIGTPFQTEP